MCSRAGSCAVHGCTAARAGIARSTRLHWQACLLCNGPAHYLAVSHTDWGQAAGCGFTRVVKPPLDTRQTGLPNRHNERTSECLPPNGGNGQPTSPPPAGQTSGHSTLPLPSTAAHHARVKTPCARKAKRCSRNAQGRRWMPSQAATGKLRAELFARHACTHALPLCRQRGARQNLPRRTTPCSCGRGKCMMGVMRGCERASAQCTAALLPASGLMRVQLPADLINKCLAGTARACISQAQCHDNRPFSLATKGCCPPSSQTQTNKLLRGDAHACAGRV